MQAQSIRAAITALRSAYEDLAACDVDTLTRDELVGAMDDLETLGCQLPTQRHRLLARLQAQTTRGSWAPSRGATCSWSGGGSRASRPIAG